jgi:hypothetical protein
VKSLDEDGLFDLIRQKGSGASNNEPEEDAVPAPAKKAKAKALKVEESVGLKEALAPSFYGKPSTTTGTASSSSHTYSSSSSSSNLVPPLSKATAPLSSSSSSNVEKPRVSSQTTSSYVFFKYNSNPIFFNLKMQRVMDHQVQAKNVSRCYGK